jgi:hypothetical protein
MTLMYRRPSKRVQLIRRMLSYALMVISIVGIVAVILLFVLGYRLDSENGLEQGALLQFNTQPTGATVTVDGAKLGTTTPNKSSVLAGSHTVTMTKNGYDSWSKTVNTPAGTLTWLDYVLLIPKNLSVETIATYPTLAGMLPSPDNKIILLQQHADQPTYQLADITSVQPKITSLTLPTQDYTAGTTNTFTIDSWDQNGRFVIVKHAYDSKTEWILLDTQDAANSKNITTLLSVDMLEVRFSGTSGAVLYGRLADGTLRKLDLNARTISAALVANVTSFELYETGIITYTGTSGNGQFVAGLYQDGDAQSDVLKTVATSDGLHIATARYFNDNYVAISSGKDVDILKGAYPHSSADNASLEPFAHFTFSNTVQSMSFSPEGEYLTVQAGSDFESYDVEHTQAYASAIQATTTGAPLRWLGLKAKADFYTDADSSLTLREFDGTNIHVMNPVAMGYAATLSQNSRFLYSIGQNNKGEMTLQRVTLVAN